MMCSIPKMADVASTDNTRMARLPDSADKGDLPCGPVIKTVLPLQGALV